MAKSLTDLCLCSIVTHPSSIAQLWTTNHHFLPPLVLEQVILVLPANQLALAYAAHCQKQLVPDRVFSEAWCNTEGNQRNAASFSSSHQAYIAYANTFVKSLLVENESLYSQAIRHFFKSPKLSVFDSVVQQLSLVDLTTKVLLLVGDLVTQVTLNGGCLGRVRVWEVLLYLTNLKTLNIRGLIDFSFGQSSYEIDLVQRMLQRWIEQVSGVHFNFLCAPEALENFCLAWYSKVFHSVPLSKSTLSHQSVPNVDEWGFEIYNAPLNQSLHSDDIDELLYNFDIVPPPQISLGCAIRELSWLNFSDDSQPISRLLNCCPLLRKLEINALHLKACSCAGLLSLASHVCPQLEDLTLCDCSIDNMIAEALAQILRQNNLGFISVVEITFAEDSSSILFNALCDATNLRSLSVQQTWLADRHGDVALLLASGIKSLNLLEKITLRFANVEPENMPALLNAMIANTHLNLLSLAHNPLYLAAKELCALVTIATMLSDINLSHCELARMDDDSIKQVFIALLSLPHLVVLHLGYNRFNQHHALAFAEHCATASSLHPHLNFIDFSNPIGYETLSQLRKVVQSGGRSITIRCSEAFYFDMDV